MDRSTAHLLQNGLEVGAFQTIRRARPSVTDGLDKACPGLGAREHWWYPFPEAKKEKAHEDALRIVCRIVGGVTHSMAW